MAVHIRLARHGGKKTPYYRIVVADQRSRRDGCFIERIGSYDPGSVPVHLRVDQRRLEYWKQQGARPSATLEQLLRKHPASEPEASTA